MIRFFVLVSGAILMSLEMAGSRVLAPHYGNSVIVWASLISVFLAGLAAGYSAGGALADASPSLTGVAAVLAAAGCFVLLIPFMAPLIFTVAGTDARIGSLAASLLLFFLPALLMGAVSPYAIRLHTVATGRLGRTAGGLYALSTVGSIAGTLATSFWLIPAVGVSNLIYGLGGSLLLLAAGVATAGGERKRVLRLALTVGVGAGVAGLSGFLASGFLDRGRQVGAGAPARFVRFEKDTFYHHIVVEDEGDRRLLRLDNLTHSAIALRDPYESRTPYTNYFHLAMALKPDARRVLFIGLGGGTAPKQFLRDYPSLQVDVAEIDPEVIVVARRFFSMPPDGSRLKVGADDGRQFLARSAESYDVIIIDAFQRDFIPFHLVTREFFTLCRSHLAPGGVVVINLIGACRGRGSAVIGSVYKTAQPVFSSRYLFAVGIRKDPSLEHYRNCILMLLAEPQMSEAQLFATIASGRGGIRQQYLQLAGDYLREGPDQSVGRSFSDEFAPVEDMLRW